MESMKASTVTSLYIRTAFNRTQFRKPMFLNFHFGPITRSPFSLVGTKQPKFKVFATISSTDSTETINPPDSELETRSKVEKFDWYAQWYPVMPVSDLDKRVPHAKKVMGLDVVAWWDRNECAWEVFDDSCPHRLAPLSEGRIDQQGRLQCVYHGWCFNGSGDCKFIPQAPPDGSPEHTFRKACVGVYPSTVQNDIVWFWPNTDPQYKDIIMERKPPYISEIDDPSYTKLMGNRDIPYGKWNWRGYSIRYQYSGNSGPALVLIHGFGANSDHWRKNIPILAKSHRVYAIDLIGYGYSDKPNPRQFSDNYYTFETWATQLNEFCNDVVKDEAFFICNSIGGVVGLQAAVVAPQICKGIIILNISLRMLHIKKQPWFGRPFIRSFQSLLRNTAVGKYFYKIVATPESVKNILCQCYHDTSQVTEELVQKILNPGLEPGAADVFLEFICYSGGPLPEELLPQVKCPVLIAWGDKDPWEPIELGRNYGDFDSVEDFVILPNVGHCPQDEAPHLVNPLVKSFVARHAAPSASGSTAI